MKHFGTEDEENDSNYIYNNTIEFTDGTVRGLMGWETTNLQFSDQLLKALRRYDLRDNIELAVCNPDMFFCSTGAHNAPSARMALSA